MHKMKIRKNQWSLAAFICHLNVREGKKKKKIDLRNTEKKQMYDK